MRSGHGSHGRTWCWRCVVMSLAVVWLPGMTLPAAADEVVPPPQAAQAAQATEGQPNAAPSKQGPRDRIVAIRMEVFPRRPEDLDNVFSNWQMAEPVVDPSEEPGAKHPAVVVEPASQSAESPAQPSSPKTLRATTVVEKRWPVLFTTLSGKEAASVIQQVRFLKSNSPRMSAAYSASDGRTVTTRFEKQVPFVVGRRPAVQAAPVPPIRYEPRIREVAEGSALRCRPTLLDGGRVSLECQLTLSSIRGAEDISVAHGPGHELLQLKIPEVETARLEFSLEMAQTDTLFLGGLRRTAKDGKQEALLITLTATEHHLEVTRGSQPTQPGGGEKPPKIR